LNRNLNNRRILSLALEALKLEREKIDVEILTIQERLGEDTPRRSRPAAKASRKNHISPAGLKAIAAAQKKRWAAHRANVKKS
jgi:hypothetical protein